MLIKRVRISMHALTCIGIQRREIKLAKKNSMSNFFAVEKGMDCMQCSFRKARLGIKIIDDFGSGGFNFFICEDCLQDLLNRIAEQKIQS